MSARCENCRSIFFKTLEMRVMTDKDPGMLYKKRCKRCKFKYLFRKDAITGMISRASLKEWQGARKLGGTAGMRGQVFASEYTLKVSGTADKSRDYLERIRRAEGGGNVHGHP